MDCRLYQGIISRTTLVLLSLLLASAACAQKVTIKVENAEKRMRHEVVEVDLKDVERKLNLKDGEEFVVRNALNQEVAYQKTYDGKLLIEVSVRPKGSAVFTMQKGIPRPVKASVSGRHYPERLDDITWENDRGIYRLYGPALQANKEQAYGIDVWLKNTPDPVVEERYATHLTGYEAVHQLNKEGRKEEARRTEDSVSFHIDHGYGHDCYKVGPTLGCGAPAVILSGKLIMPYCYETYNILDNGPLRFTVELTYCPTDMGANKGVVEHRLVSLDKGMNYNKMTVWYEGLRTGAEVAAGIVVHSEDAESQLLTDSYALYADPTENPSGQNFQIFTGLLFPNKVDRVITRPTMATPGVTGHLLGIRHVNNNERFTYYFGSAWSKYDVRSLAEWKVRSEETLAAIKAPLKPLVLH